MIELNPDVLKKLLYDSEAKRLKFEHYYSLYKGQHSILKKTVSDVNKPCNMLINAFYKQIVDYPASYFLGKPVTITHNIDADINDEINAILTDNFSTDVFFETCKEADIKGVSSLIVYQDEIGKTKMIRCPAEEMIFIENPSTKELNYAIRHYTVEDVITNTYTQYVELYTPTDVNYYTQEYNVETLTLTKSLPHIFGVIPVVKIVSNEEEQSILEVIETLVCDYDKIISDNADLHEAYKKAYMLMKNVGNLNEDQLRKMYEHNIIELPEGADISYLKLELNQDSVEKHLDRIEKNIHKFSYTPDLSDEKFAGNLSGVAILFKLYGMEVRAGAKERKLTRALQHLLKILAEPIRVKTGKMLSIKDIQFQFTRNIPANVKEAIDGVVALNGTGMVDKETLLSLLPFIENPQAILEKVAEEQANGVTDYNNFHNIDDTIPGSNNSIKANPNMIDANNNPMSVKGAV